MGDPAANFATPHVASGALFVERNKIFLVRKTYGNRWDIPGGYIDRGESPVMACEREVREELGINRTVERLLVHDWAPSETEGDKALYVFGCGKLGDDEGKIVLDGVEIDKTEWVPVDVLADYLIPRLVRRLTAAYNAHITGTILYLENGRPLAM
jgi:8-oxo-dGTP diphosphatase